MHRILTLSIVLGIIFFCACKPSRTHRSGPFTGKVLGDICSQYTIQLVSGDMDPARYVKDWKNEQTDSVYHNVFAVANYCDFNKSGLRNGDVFQFYLLSDSTPQNCAVCLIYSPRPNLYNTIKVISTSK